MKKNHKTSIPRRILFLDTETEGVKISKIEERHTMKLACTCYMQRSRGKKKDWHEEWKFFKSKTKTLEYIDRILIDRQPLYLMGSNIFFDLMALGFIKYFTKREWELKFCYSGGMSFILVCKKNGLIMKCFSTQNYAPVSVKQMGEVVGLKKLECNFEKISDKELKKYCRRDTEIIRNFILEYIKYITDNDMGRFSYTRASQALNLYRHRFMDYDINIHANNYASDLEHNCYFGGRTECFRIGKFKGKKLTYVDVNSMYPYIMERDTFPTKLLGFSDSPSIKWLLYNIEKYKFCAEITVNTDKNCYALRKKGKVIFPLGKFRCFVNTYGLKYALKNNHLVKIHTLTYYEHKSIFKKFVNTMYGLKLQHKKEGKKVWQEMDKYIMNSLYGKFGQQKESLIEENYIASDDFSRENYYNHSSGEFETCQKLFHKKQIFSGKEPTNNTFFAIPGHVTEGARFYLWELINKIGKEKIYYMDTDSLIFPSGMENKIKPYLDENRLGALKIERRTQSLTILGCKDYVFGKITKRKGIRKNAKKINNNTFQQDYFPGMKKVMAEGIEEGFPIFQITKTLKRIYTKGKVLKNGKIRPWVFPEERQDFERQCSIS